jgi:hypothetical protein
MKFAGFYNTTVTQHSGNSSMNTSISLCQYGDSSDKSAGMVPYMGFLLLISLVNIIVTSVLYIPVAKTIYKRFFKPMQNRMKSLERDASTKSKDISISTAERYQTMGNPRQDENQTYTKHAATGKDERLKEQKTHKKMNVMFLVIIIVYVVSYLTSLVTHVHFFSTGLRPKGYKRNIYYSCLRFNLLNHIANPYIYLFYDIKFRNEFRQFCCGCTKRYVGVLFKVK